MLSVQVGSFATGEDFVLSRIALHASVPGTYDQVCLRTRHSSPLWSYLESVITVSEVTRRHGFEKLNSNQVLQMFRIISSQSSSAAHEQLNKFSHWVYPKKQKEDLETADIIMERDYQQYIVKRQDLQGMRRRGEGKLAALRVDFAVSALASVGILNNGSSYTDACTRNVYDKSIQNTKEFDKLSVRTKSRYTVHRNAYQQWVQRFYEDKYQRTVSDDEVNALCWPMKEGVCDFWIFMDQLIGFIFHKVEVSLPRDRRETVIKWQTIQQYIMSMLYWSNKEYSIKHVIPPNHTGLLHHMQTAAQSSYEKLRVENENTTAPTSPPKDKTWLTRDELAMILSDDLHKVKDIEYTECMQLGLLIARGTCCRPSTLGPDHHTERRRKNDYISWRDLSIEREMNLADRSV